MGTQLVAPRVIPPRLYTPATPEPPRMTASTIGDLDSQPGNGPGVWGEHRPGPSVRPEPQTKATVSQGVMDGFLVGKILPEYPPIAREAGIEGTVILQATISKQGTIENLRVVSGPPMLQQAAITAVSRWRYRPYLLNGEPVEVETTVNVRFTMH